jgi:rhomboid protease GluP
VTLTRALVFVNVIAFIWLSFTGGSDSALSLYQHGALYGVAVQQGQWWRIVTGAFLHGGLQHIFFNMIALWQVGALCETLFGRARFAAIYIIAMVASGIAIVYITPEQVTVGASGAIFGLFGALVAAGLRLGQRGGILIKQTLPVIVINLIFTFAVPNISITAHIGGLISGFVAGFLLFAVPQAIAAHEHAAQPVRVAGRDAHGEIIEGELLDPEPQR